MKDEGGRMKNPELLPSSPFRVPSSSFVLIPRIPSHLP